jgi:hypothetical protein
MSEARTGRRARNRRLLLRPLFPRREGGPFRKKAGLFALLVLGLAGLIFSASFLSFTISPTTISFPDLDPDAYPAVPASNTLGISFLAAGLTTGQTWALEFGARSDFTSGSNTIPISNVRWTISGTAVPPGSFQNGTLSLNVFQPAGSGPGSAFTLANVNASAQFILGKSWSYAPGTYTASVDVRVTVPGSVRTRTATLTITIASRVSLTLGMGTINFPAAHPDLVPSVPANENPVTVTISVHASSSAIVTLTCLAGGDLVSGSNTISAGAVSWTATGTGFLSGTMSRTSAQPAGQWTGLGTRSGTFSFRLANSWNYAVGAYSTSVVYTLTAL